MIFTHFARLAPEVFVAHGYSGQGIAIATLAGQLIAEAVAGTAERFDVMADLEVPRFGMLYYGLRNRL